MFDIDNFASYKLCRRKHADYWLCKPPLGTVIISKFEQYNVWSYLKKFIPVLNNRCYLTAKEANKIMEVNPQLYSYIQANCFITNKVMCMVLCGTEGELYATTYNFVCSRYLIYSNNGFVPITQSVISGKLSDYKNEKVMGWCRVTTKFTNIKEFACFVPKSQKGYILTQQGKKQYYNLEGVSHGKGDFIVCEFFNGKPNLQNRWVVNGLVFSNTYDNKGWLNEVSISRMGISEPPDLWVEDNSTADKLQGDSLREYLLNWFKKYSIQNAYEYITNNNLKQNVLNNLKRMTNIASYLMCGYNFSDFCSDEEVIGSEGLRYFSILCRLGDIRVNICYPNGLCGWNYEDDNGEFAEDSYEVECNSKTDIDDFIETLKSSISTYMLLRKLYVSINGADDLVKALDSFDTNEISMLNDSSFNYRMMHTFVTLLMGAKKLYSSHKVCLDYNDDILTYHVKVDAVNNYASFGVNLYTGSISAFFFCDEHNTDIYETSIAYNDFDGIKDFLNRVKMNDATSDARTVIESLKMPKNTVSFSGDIVYFSYQDNTYSSNVGKFAQILFEICKELDSETNFTAIIDLSNAGYDNVTELAQDEFINKLFICLDSSVRVCIYNKETDLIRIRDLSVAYFEVLSITKVKRVYGKIIYTSGMEIYVNISKSTLELLEYEHPELVRRNLGGIKPAVKFISLHYHQLMLRMGLLRSIYNIKRFKLEYARLNQSIFDDELSHQLVVSIGNYDRIMDSTFDSDSTTAHYIGQTINSIVLNGRNVSLQDDLTSYAKTVLIHEMCHCYVEKIYGTSKELSGEDGGSYMGLGTWCEEQWCYHGKRFAEAVKMAEKKSGYSFDSIFGYGVGHSNLLKDNTGVFTSALIARNAFDLGQAYRNSGVCDMSGETLCKKHGVLNCKCDSKDRVVIPAGRYVGICRVCGELMIYDDDTIGTLTDVSIAYFDVVDRIGIIAMSKCSKCGGSVMPVVSNSSIPKDKMKLYLSDLYFANRYVNHLADICSSNKDKYENYFKRNYNCSLNIYRGKFPYLCVDISNGSGFEEKYKLFVSCSASGRLMGKLYRDYDLGMKGRLIHTFRINTDKDILKFLNYTMTYIKKDLRDI